MGVLITLYILFCIFSDEDFVDFLKVLLVGAGVLIFIGYLLLKWIGFWG